MPTYVGFLRAINVGGHTVTMERLRSLVAETGVQDVETFIASGNVVFVSPSADRGTLARRIEDHLRSSLGYDVKTFIRTAAEVVAIASYEPFSASRVTAATALNVGLLAGPLSAGEHARLMALETGVDAFHVHGREVYWLCQTKQSQSGFSNTRFEKTVAPSITFRSVNTMVRLVQKFRF